MTTEAPLAVSVIVLAYAVVEPLDACLAALTRELADHAAEVVVVVNGTSAGIDAVLAAHEDLVVVRPPVNLGFAGGCNAGAAVARGDVLVFLNDDAVVHDGWLRALLDRLDRDPAVAAVGSAISSGGVVLEAGGRLEGGIHPEALHRGDRLVDLGPASPVEWATGCSLAVRRSAFEAVSGFDPVFHPAYFEDVDLCLRLREQGWQIWVEPTSVVEHAESSSTTAIAKSVHFERSRATYLARWGSGRAHALGGSHRTGSTARSTAATRTGQPVVLVIDDVVPHAAKGGGMPRMIQHLRGLRDAGVSVRFAPVHPHFEPTEDHDDLGVTFVDLPVPGGPMLDLDAIVASRPHNFARAEQIAARYPGVPLLYDAEALFHARLFLHARLVADPVERATLLRAAMEVEATEAAIARRATCIIAISEEEAVWFQRQGATDVSVLSPFAGRAPAPGTRTFAERHGALLLCGWTAGPTSPNADGVRWLAEEVLPRTLERAPGLEVRVTGASPPESLRALSSASLRFVGEVDDVHGALAVARCAVVPIRFGAGVKLKTVDALQAGVPVVATSIGAEGIPERWAGGMAVADDPSAFAEAVVAMVTSPSTWRRHRDALDAAVAAPLEDGAPSWDTVLASLGLATTRSSAQPPFVKVQPR